MTEGSERGARHRSRRPPAAGSRAADAADAAAAGRSTSGGPVVERKPAEAGPANERWRALLAEGGPILADGAMGTMLFASGLQFGDPPEVWNVSQPEVVRRIHRGYLEAGSRIVMTNTFGGNRLRLRLHGLQERVGELNRTAAILLRTEVDAAGGGALVAGDIGPTGEIMAPLGTLSDEEAIEVFAEQAAALIAGGVDVIWIETMSHLSEIGAAIRGVRQVSAGIPIIATMTFDTRGHTMMGVSPEQAVAVARGVGRRCDRRQLRQRPGRAAAGHRADARGGAGRHPRREVERRDAGAGRHAGGLPGRSGHDGGGRARLPGGRRPDHRGVLREHAGSPQGDGGGAGGSSLTGRRSPASIRVARRFSAGVSGHENFGA